MKTCKHCKGDLVAHEDGAGYDEFLHCDACGCCFLKDGKTVRPGHPACRESTTFEVVTEDEAPKPPRTKKVNRGTGN